MLTPEQFEEQKKLLQEEKLQSLIKELKLEQFIRRAVRNIEKALSEGETFSETLILGTNNIDTAESCFEYIGEKIDEQLEPHGWKIRRMSLNRVGKSFPIGRWSAIHIFIESL